MGRRRKRKVSHSPNSHLIIFVQDLKSKLAVDDQILGRLDESAFIERLYANVRSEIVLGFTRIESRTPSTTSTTNLR
jgi:hypothetical protein